MLGRHVGMLATVSALAIVSAGCDFRRRPPRRGTRTGRPGARVKASRRSSRTSRTSWSTSASTSATSGSPGRVKLAARGLLPGRDEITPPLGRPRIPIRKDNQGREVNLVNILEAFENSQLTQLKGTVDRKDKGGFERLYKECLTVCYSCHKAADKPYLRPQVPTEPATRVINFNPRADWPL